MYILLIFDTVEYSNCLEYVYFFKNKKDINNILKDHIKQIKRGFEDFIIINLFDYKESIERLY